MKSKRLALLSVSDKQGIAAFAAGLAELGFELASTGGTARVLRGAGLAVTDVSTLTGFPEMMDGRVKTLHPAIHGGLLARRGTDDAVLADHGIRPIDVLAVNLYPFEEVTALRSCTAEVAIENIDVGGPAMLRAAAKNHEHTAVVVDPADYDRVLEALRTGGTGADLRRALAVKAFAHTAAYDAAIARYLRADGPAGAWPEPLVLAWRGAEPLRYGENPHQRAALYRDRAAPAGGIAKAALVQGKPLSYNNLVDADTALECAAAFAGIACVIVKHANPCGIGVAEGSAAAYELAYRADPTSAFGGVIAFNRTLDETTAATIVGRQKADVIVAPRVDDGARRVLAQKKGMRVLECEAHGEQGPAFELKSIGGGVLLQERDGGAAARANLAVVTRRAPTEAELRDLEFAWRAVRFVKSNAIVFARDGATLGIGAGQPSRVMSARIAGIKAAEARLSLDGAAMASDAFFPFRDGIDIAAELGIRAVIQPGGSVRDEEIVRAADEHGIAMVLTGIRHFRH